MGFCSYIALSHVRGLTHFAQYWAELPVKALARFVGDYHIANNQVVLLHLVALLCTLPNGYSLDNITKCGFDIVGEVLPEGGCNVALDMVSLLLFALKGVRLWNSTVSCGML